MAESIVCRACKRTNTYAFLPLGDHPPANAFLRKEELSRPEPRFPLDTIACLDCGLILVRDQLPADFFTEYLYVPSGSETMKRHFTDFAKAIRDRWISDQTDRVVDIGCNDGLLLKACANLEVATLGVEPAANIAEMARSQGLEVFNEYFTSESAGRIRERWGPAKVIVTTNTFNHIDDLHGFVTGVSTLLADNGTFIIEVPEAIKYVEMTEFDTVYHEHLSTFTVKSLADLFDFFGMKIVDIEPLPIHGGSMRVSARRESFASQGAGVAQAWIQREREAGLFEKSTYDAVATRTGEIRTTLVKMLRQLKEGGAKLAGYGAPAKGNTLLNYCAIGTDLLDFLADRNPLKHGRYSPGMHIPILPAEHIAEASPDYLLILAWNFADEIMTQQAAFQAAGGKFILPIPEPRILG
ncbi:MAG TPA: class I SAM-dependent methyltransferase [Gemmatimonadaceae bacterium]|nr:class I SAM-dependent methyltransferase [Gemmatimonadaceae bacterium]